MEKNTYSKIVIKVGIVLFLIFPIFSLGQEILQYNSSNSILPEMGYGCIAVDSSNTIWISATGGAYTFANNTWQKEDEVLDISSDEYPIDIEVSPNNDVWFCMSRERADSTNKNFYRKRNNVWSKYNFDCGLRFPTSMFIENDSTIYFSLHNWWPHQLGEDAIGILQKEEFVLHEQNLWGIGTKQIFPIEKDTLITSGWLGVGFYSGDTNIIKNPNGIVPQQNMWNVAKFDNRVFVFDSCLYEYYNGAYISFLQIDSIIQIDSSFITCMNIENKNTLWIGTNKGSLIQYKNGKAETYKLVEEKINDLIIDKGFNKWFITYKGCFIYNENSIVDVLKETNYNKPTKFSLSQNYPNPFNPTTTIKYSIPSTQTPLLRGVGGVLTTLKIYDILGREVATLVSNEQKPGNYEVQFDGKGLTSGIYFYKLQSGSFVESRKMILIK